MDFIRSSLITNALISAYSPYYADSIRNIYYQAYTMVLDVARKAETALLFEQGQSPMLLCQGGYWDAGHDGLLSADDLLLDLKRLQSAYRNFKHDLRSQRRYRSGRSTR
jgi:hypothetical protein